MALTYCNGIFGSTSAVHLRPLEFVLNTVARLIVERRKFDRITASLRNELLGLPVQQRYTYKICLLVYKCLHATALSYLVEQCTPIAVNPARSSLRSASNSGLMYPRTDLVRYGQRSFSVIGQRIWNQLPLNMKGPSLSFDNFCRRFKTVLSNRAYYASQCAFVMNLTQSSGRYKCTNVLTYLLTFDVYGVPRLLYINMPIEGGYIYIYIYITFYLIFVLLLINVG